MKHIFTVIALMCLLASAQVLAITGETELRRDPFSRSKVQKLLDENNKAKIKQPQVIRWQPKLLATIVAGDQSMVNIDGKILRLGDTVDRYRLVKVTRYTATFKRAGKFRKIKLYNPVDGQ